MKRNFRIVIYDENDKVSIINDGELTGAGRLPKWAQQMIENFVHYRKPARLEITSRTEG